MSYETVSPIAYRTDVFDEYINEDLKNIDYSLIKFQNKLNQNLFQNEIIKPDIRKILIRIFEYFITSINNNVIFDKVTITGSMVNYNYNKYSDIDIHILINKNDYNSIEEFEKIYDIISTKIKLWNYQHENIKLINHNIELYLQDLTEIHKSTGIYDLLLNEWINKPSKQVENIDKNKLKSKLNNLIYKIENILKTNDINKIENFIDSIKKYRKEGLESEGEYSYENLIYKYIKHYGYMNKLQNLKRKLSI